MFIRLLWYQLPLASQNLEQISTILFLIVLVADSVIFIVMNRRVFGDLSIRHLGNEIGLLTIQKCRLETLKLKCFKSRKHKGRQRA